jgi:drug/metabolite transporter (DMT)-like permease
LYGEALGLILLFGAEAVFPETPMPWQGWVWCCLSGVIGATGLLILYRAMTESQMSLAAPISGLAAAALPVAAGSLLQGLPRPVTLLGFVLALLAVWLVSQGQGTSPQTLTRLAELRLPLISGVAFGMYFILIHQGSGHGLLWPLIAARCGGTICLSLYAIFQRELKLPRLALLPWVMLNAVGDLGGNTFYILAGQIGRMDVAAVLGSLYPGGTVVLAWLLLREKITRPQFAGILTALAAIALLTL